MCVIAGMVERGTFNRSMPNNVFCSLVADSRRSGFTSATSSIYGLSRSGSNQSAASA